MIRYDSMITQTLTSKTDAVCDAAYTGFLITRRYRLVTRLRANVRPTMTPHTRPATFEPTDNQTVYRVRTAYSNPHLTASLAAAFRPSMKKYLKSTHFSNAYFTFFRFSALRQKSTFFQLYQGIYM